MVWGVGQFNYAIPTCIGHTLVAMATKISYFQQKIGYNSACTGDMPQMLAPTRGFSGSANLMVQSNFAQTTPVAILTKNWEFYQKICHNLGCI